MNIKSSFSAFYYALKSRIFRIASKVNPKIYVDYRFKEKFNRKIDWEHPRDLNEVINYMKFHSDKKEWGRLADKYLVREYLLSKGLGDYLVPIYGVYDHASEIDPENLPDKFIIKTNGGSGDYTIVEDKTKVDWDEIKKRYEEILKEPYGAYYYEPHYKKIKRKIVIEKLLDKNQQEEASSSLIDYKIFCFNGEPYCIIVFGNRTPHKVEVGVYDLDWKPVEYAMLDDPHYPERKEPYKKPEKLEQMLKLARILSKGHPEVRVDLYYVEGRIYFGELTLTSWAGFNHPFTDKFLKELGSQVSLPK